MAETTTIEWTVSGDGTPGATFNPWVGCQKVSPGCDHCYAEGWAKRSGLVKWGPGAQRRRTSPANWRKPLKWNAGAEASGIRRKVFCASLADVFDNQVPQEWRAALWDLIAATPCLDWLLLTKRPQNIVKMLPYNPFVLAPEWPWPNVWLGTTVENQEEADRRISHLLAVPATVHFLSCEPLLGPIDITEHLWGLPGAKCCSHRPHNEDCKCGWQRRKANSRPSIDWCIVGGESRPKRRPVDLQWMRDLLSQCAAADVPFFG